MSNTPGSGGGQTPSSTTSLVREILRSFVENSAAPSHAGGVGSHALDINGVLRRGNNSCSNNSSAGIGHHATIGSRRQPQHPESLFRVLLQFVRTHCAAAYGALKHAVLQAAGALPATITAVFRALAAKKGIALFLLTYYGLHKLAQSVDEAGRKKREDNSGTKVAVIGAGIAGLGAAWALHRSGFDVTVFEKKPTVGGNAKAHNWVVQKDDGSPAIVRTGLSVLAWPREHFHNYNMLIDEFGIETVDHQLKFCVGVKPTARSEADLVYVHGRESHSLAALAKSQERSWLATDLIRWKRTVRFVVWVNKIFSPMINGAKSLYRVNMFNPLNLIPLKWLTRLFGVSSKFWNEVFVPVHTSTFLESDMNELPALMAEVLEDLVPLSDPSKVIPTMATWKAGNGDEVFENLIRGFEDRVHTSDEVQAVRFVTRPDGHGGVKKMAQVDHYKSSPNSGPEEFDHVLFACSAPAARRCLDVFATDEPSFFKSLKHYLTHFVAKQVLSRVTYAESRDTLFTSGEAHSDIDAVFPEPYRREIVENYCNYIECTPRGPDDKGSNHAAPYNYENSFIISSWCPPAIEACKDQKKRRPMMVSYNCGERVAKVPMNHYERSVTGKEAHPSLTIQNMGMSKVLWPQLQGMHDNVVYFAGSAITPGNGHDLSFLSGLIIAKKLGADYPFAANASAASDFERLRGLMGVSIP